MRAKILLMILWVGLVGCAGDREDPVVAKVGDRVVRAGELKEFIANVLPALRTKKTGLEGAKDYLNAKIDLEIMLLEARSRGLDRTDGFITKLEQAKRRKVLEVFRQREIADKVEISEEELQRYFAELGWDREKRFSVIAVRTREEADTVMAELKRGRKFEDLASEYSWDMDLGPKGGDLGFLDRHDAVWNFIDDRIYDMDVGEVSEPVEVRAVYRQRYQIFKVTDERPAKLENSRRRLSGRLFQKKYAERMEALAEKLARKYHLMLNTESLSFLLGKIRSAGEGPVRLSPQESGAWLYKYDAGRITVGDFVNTVGRRGLSEADSAQLVAFAKQRLLPPGLFWEEARRAHIPQEKEVVSWVHKKEEELLIMALRKAEVKDRVVVGEEEAKAFYDEHPDLFVLPSEIDLQEILTDTEEEAERLLQEIREGADMGELAWRHTRRQAVREAGGVFRIRSFEKFRYKGLFEEAENAEIGALKGPVRVEEGYSIFRVLSKKDAKKQPFERVIKRARAYVRMRKEEERFKEFMVELREKYAPKVTVFEENLKIVAMAKGS